MTIKAPRTTSANEIQRWRVVKQSSESRGQSSALPHPPSIHHRAFDGNADNAIGVFLEYVTPQYYEVGQLARLDRTLQVFFERSVGAIHGSHANRFFQRDLLLRPPDIALSVGARYFRLQRHHWFKRPRRIIRRLGWPDSGIDEAAQRKHVVHAIRSVLLHLLAVIVSVGGKWSWNGAQRFDSRDQRIVDNRAVLQPVTSILARQCLLQPFVHAQRYIDADIAIGVGRELPSGGVRLACLLV